MPKSEDLQKRIAELETVAATARSNEELARTEQALTGKVNPSMVQAAALLLQSRGAVRRDSSDAIVFNAPGMPMNLGEGVAAWTKTAEARDFLPRPKRLTGQERVRETFLSDLSHVSDE